MIKLNPRSAGNHEHIEMWLEDLWNTTAPQANGHLAKEVEGEVGYCCLGLGCVTAGIEMSTGDGGEDEDVFVYQFEYQEDLPPVSFHQWLGLANPDGADVQVDWPVGPEAYLCRPIIGPSKQERPGGPMDWSCAGLNDDCGLTFPQIADVIAYFGLRNG